MTKRKQRPNRNATPRKGPAKAEPKRPKMAPPLRHNRDGSAPPKGDRPPRNSNREETRGVGEGTWLYGTHAVLAALANPKRKLKSLMATLSASRDLPPDLRFKPQIVEMNALSARLPPGSVHQGLALLAAPLAELTLDDVCPDHGPSLIVALDQVTDPHNVGAILRSAAAFGAHAVVVTDRHAPAITGVLAKAASGAVELVPLIRVVNLARALDELGALGYWRVGLDSEAPESLGGPARSDRIALVLGAEGAGLRRLTKERCDALVRLPTQGPIRSLNVSNAAAVALYALRPAVR